MNDPRHILAAKRRSNHDTNAIHLFTQQCRARFGVFSFNVGRLLQTYAIGGFRTELCGLARYRAEPTRSQHASFSTSIIRLRIDARTIIGDRANGRPVFHEAARAKELRGMVASHGPRTEPGRSTPSFRPSGREKCPPPVRQQN